VLTNAPERTPEVRLALARAWAELGAFTEARALLSEVEAERPHDWRIAWYRAVVALSEGRPDAVALFDDLYSLLPGEAAPKLALAYCKERTDPQGAAGLYDTVWRTDRSYISAAFGLARVRLAAGDRQAATGVLDSVPKVAIQYIAAQVAAVATVVRDRPPEELTAADLEQAGARLQASGLDGVRRDRLATEILEAALAWVERNTTAAGGVRGSGFVLETPLAEQPLRRRLEETYRSLARHTTDRENRSWLIDCANAVRPRTLL
jgi:serine/threonine-protein kinase PknG